MRYVIQVPYGYVLEINRDHGTIVCVAEQENARHWDTPSKAKQWLNRYADCGYGLNSESASIVGYETISPV